LVEEYHPEDQRYFGRSTQNKSVHFTAPESGTGRDPKLLVGQTLPVLITEAYPSTLHGRIYDNH
jgi:tRNA A37 methylthiotransferase MiaB